jgi:methionyl-tRNA formyltransferase
LKTINVHFSALPKYRGATPMQFALLNGDPTTTITVFILDELLDHGPVLTQTPVAIDPCDTFATLADRLAVLSGPLVISTLTDYASGNITPKEQDHSEATYTKILTKEDGRVDWSRTAAEIHNQFRAFYPWPGLWTTWEGKTVKIKDCSVAPNLSSSLEPGTVLDGGIIACGHKTALQILQLQLEGKTTVDIKEFLNGYKNFNGSKLI